VWYVERVWPKRVAQLAILRKSISHSRASEAELQLPFPAEGVIATAKLTSISGGGQLHPRVLDRLRFRPVSAGWRLAPRTFASYRFGRRIFLTPRATARPNLPKLRHQNDRSSDGGTTALSSRGGGVLSVNRPADNLGGPGGATPPICRWEATSVNAWRSLCRLMNACSETSVYERRKSPRREFTQSLK
jgi:hypothetical protein